MLPIIMVLQRSRGARGRVEDLDLGIFAGSESGFFSFKNLDLVTVMLLKYQMVTQNMLRPHERKYVFWIKKNIRFVTALNQKP